MKQFSIAVIVAILVLGPQLGAQQRPRNKFIVYGIGNASCGVWQKATGDNHSSLLVWVHGFISGFGFGGPDIPETDSDAIDVFVTNYCREHILDSVAEASRALVYALKAKE